MKKHHCLIVLVLVGILFGTGEATAQQTYPESATPDELPHGIFYQSGPGGNNLEGWAFPYGTKLSVMHLTKRNFELMAKHKKTMGFG